MSGTVLRSLLHGRTALSGLGAVLLVFRLLCADRLPADRVPYGVDLADGVVGRPAVRLCLLLGRVARPSSAVYDARRPRGHHRRLRGGRGVARLPTRRADVQPSTSPIAGELDVPVRQQVGGCRDDRVQVRADAVRRAPRDALLQRLLLVASAAHPRHPVLGARLPQLRPHPNNARRSPATMPDDLAASDGIDAMPDDHHRDRGTGVGIRDAAADIAAVRP